VRQPATLDGLNQSAASVFERDRIVDRNQCGVVEQCKDGPPLEPLTTTGRSRASQPSISMPIP
jgi:hypothetical protein